ncbi:uncharacterized protein LOC115654039 [Gopherus evgoodei]|uniref:uncharacterized protein LOC115654039 n=1 Tax=Gopherus evgoodei TaxID=1825980 RepID=UPI0011D00C55|nr:uncharacterized protein LOC115654039 [Gopherus evgoodei]
MSGPSSCINIDIPDRIYVRVTSRQIHLVYLSARIGCLGEASFCETEQQLVSRSRGSVPGPAHSAGNELLRPPPRTPAADKVSQQRSIQAVLLHIAVIYLAGGADWLPRAILRSGHLELLVCLGSGSSQSAGAAASPLKRTPKDTEARRFHKKGKSDCWMRPLRALHRYAVPFQALSLDQPVHPFQIGDQVLVKKWKRGPLTPRWDGPDTVSLISQAAVKILGSDKWTHHTWVKRFLNPNLEAGSAEEDISPLSAPAPEARGGTGENPTWEYHGLDGLKGLFKKK